MRPRQCANWEYRAKLNIQSHLFSSLLSQLRSGSIRTGEVAVVHVRVRLRTRLAAHKHALSLSA